MNKWHFQYCSCFKTTVSYFGLCSALSAVTFKELSTIGKILIVHYLSMAIRNIPLIIPWTHRDKWDKQTKVDS